MHVTDRGRGGQKVRDWSGRGVGKGSVQCWLGQVGVMGRISGKGCESDLGRMDSKEML